MSCSDNLNQFADSRIAFSSKIYAVSLFAFNAIQLGEFPPFGQFFVSFGHLLLVKKA